MLSQGVLLNEAVYGAGWISRMGENDLIAQEVDIDRGD